MTVLEVLKEAKHKYQTETIPGSPENCGMCYCIKVTVLLLGNRENPKYTKHPPYAEIVKSIPEFNPIFLEAPYSQRVISGENYGLNFWWPQSNCNSRIEAFDKLIHLYEGSAKVFII